MSDTNMPPHTPPADNSGPKPGKCEALVLAYYNSDPLPGYPANVNLASAFTYKLLVQTPDGPTIANGAYPEVPRPPPPWLVTAFAVQDPKDKRAVMLPGSMMDGRFRLQWAEDRYADTCTPSNTGSIFNG